MSLTKSDTLKCPTCGAPMLVGDNPPICSHLFSHELPRPARDLAVARVLAAVRAYRLAIEASAALLCPPDGADTGEETFEDLVRSDEAENAAHDELVAADTELAKLDGSGPASSARSTPPAPSPAARSTPLELAQARSTPLELEAELLECDGCLVTHCADELHEVQGVRLRRPGGRPRFCSDCLAKMGGTK